MSIGESSLEAAELTLRPSPNWGERLGVSSPSLIVLHYTGMPSASAALDRLCSADSGVSAHYQIDERGRVVQMVCETRRAWHAGVATWRGEKDVNSLSIGIELAHPGHDDGGDCPPFPEPQMRALEGAIAAMRARWRLPLEAVVAHSDVAPARKIDPGERFDWRRLDRLKMGISDRWKCSRQPEIALFWDSLAVIGYGAWPENLLLDAFRRRFRPEAVLEGSAGAPTSEDAIVAAAVASRIVALRQIDGGYL